MAGCPYTATIDFFLNLRDALSPVTDNDAFPVEKSVSERMTDALGKIRRISGLVVNPTDNAASTVRGNYPITVYIGAKDASTDSVVISEMHGILRGLMGTMGKQLDKESLPQSLQDQIKQFAALQQEYKKNGTALAEMYEKECEKNHQKQKLYDELKELRDHVSGGYPDLAEDQTYQSTLETMDNLNMKSEMFIRDINLGLGSQGAIKIKGAPDRISNKMVDKGTTLAEWMYYAEWAAGAFANTLKITEALSSTYGSKINNTAGIIPLMCNIFADDEELHHPAILTHFERAVEKAQYAVVRCGSYKKLAKYPETRAFMEVLDITSKKDYDAVKTKAPIQIKTNGKDATKKVEGVCPLGYGVKKEELKI